jgi:hypothetical protein
MNSEEFYVCISRTQFEGTEFAAVHSNPGKQLISDITYVAGPQESFQAIPLLKPCVAVTPSAQDLLHTLYGFDSNESIDVIGADILGMMQGVLAGEFRVQVLGKSCPSNMVFGGNEFKVVQHQGILLDPIRIGRDVQDAVNAMLITVAVDVNRKFRLASRQQKTCSNGPDVQR